MSWTLWTGALGRPAVKELLDWFGLDRRGVVCCAIQHHLPAIAERMDKKVSDLVQTVAKLEIPEASKHFDIVVACEDDEGRTST